MKKLAVAAIVAAVLAVGTSGAALYRTRHLSSSNSPSSTSSEVPTSSGQLIEVPDTTNLAAVQAVTTLSALQLKFTMTRAPSDTVGTNYIISQDPAPATPVPAGTVVKLTVSSGTG